MGRFDKMGGIDLAGMRFGKLTALHRADDYPDGKHTKWHCICDCGKEKDISTYSLTKGITKSCGCSATEHRLAHLDEIGRKVHDKRLYSIWSNMVQRCNNPNTKCYVHYGGRGIKISPEWKDYSNFEKWALNSGYSEKLTLDRIDVNGDYCPMNCRWITHKEQCNNTRYNVFVEYLGEKYTIAQLSEKTGIKYSILYNRIHKLGWNVYEAVSTPIQK